MVKERASVQSGQASISRKRALQDEDGAAATSSTKRSNREPSPAKNVKFRRHLEQGPTITRADHRNQSPRRPALHHRNGDEEDEDNDDHIRSNRAHFDEMDNGLEWDFGGGFAFESAPLPAPPSSWSPGNDLGLAVSRLEGHLPKRIKPSVSAEYSSPETKTVPEYGSSTGSEDTDGNADLSEAAPDMHHQASISALPDIESLHTGEEKDAAICTAMHRLRDMAKHYALCFPGEQLEDDRDVLKELLVGANDKLIRYIGCLAIGGPHKDQSWAELLRNGDCRLALVFGIIGKALKEIVFSDLWFGGSDAEKKTLGDDEQASVNIEGFERTRQRAKKCIDFQKNSEKRRDSAQQLLKAKAKVALQLNMMLLPLWSITTAPRIGGVRRRRAPATDRPFPLRPLAEIVSFAGDISRLIRQVQDVVYYWPPTFKDEEFEPARMECFNLRSMIEKSPYEKKNMHGRVRAVLQPSEEAIVRVVCFPGLVAYRKGGGELAERLLGEEGRAESHRHEPPDVRRANARQAQHDGVTVHSGFRTKVICKAVVHLQWGKQRLLTKEAGTSAHLDAMRDHSNKYQLDRTGFVELYDVYQRRMPTCKNCNGKGHTSSTCRKPPSGGSASWTIVESSSGLEKPGKAGGSDNAWSSRSPPRRGNRH